MNEKADVRLLCARCDAPLVPILAPWAPHRNATTAAFLCPRLAACGAAPGPDDALVRAAATRSRRSRDR